MIGSLINHPGVPPNMTKREYLEVLPGDLMVREYTDQVSGKAGITAGNRQKVKVSTQLFLY